MRREVGSIGEVVQSERELTLARREAHVDDAVPFLDRPTEAGEQDVARARRVRPEHTDACELDPRRQRAHDAGAGGAVTARVALAVLLDGDLVLAPGDDDRPIDPSHERMAGLDAGVDDGDTHARARRAAERPLARHAVRPVRRETLLGAGGQAPRGELAVGGRLVPVRHGGILRFHAAILRLGL